MDIEDVNISDPSERRDAIQQLIAKEMKASGCDYNTARNRVGRANPELFGAMVGSDDNQYFHKGVQAEGKKEKDSMARTRAASPSAPPGAVKFPQRSQSPPQVNTLRDHGTKLPERGMETV